MSKNDYKKDTKHDKMPSNTFCLNYSYISKYIPELRKYITGSIQLDDDIYLSKDQYYEVIFEGSSLTEKLLLAFLKNNISYDDDKNTSLTLDKLIKYVKHIWPKEIIEFLLIIQKYRNNATHNNLYNHLETNLFVKAFALYVKFYFSDIKIITQSQEEKITITSLLELIDYSLNISFGSRDFVPFSNYENITVNVTKETSQVNSKSISTSSSENILGVAGAGITFGLLSPVISGIGLAASSMTGAIAAATATGAVGSLVGGNIASGNPLINTLTLPFSLGFISSNHQKSNSGLTRYEDLDIDIPADNITLEFNRKQLENSLCIIKERQELIDRKIKEIENYLRYAHYDYDDDDDDYLSSSFMSPFSLFGNSFTNKKTRISETVIKSLEEAKHKLKAQKQELSKQKETALKYLNFLREIENKNQQSALERGTDESGYPIINSTNEEKVSNSSNFEDYVITQLKSIIGQLNALDQENHEAHASHEQKLEEISSTLSELTSRIDCYHSLLEAQLNRIVDESQREQIIAAFIDECADKITYRVSTQFNMSKHITTRDILIEKLGSEAWKKLSLESQQFLVSAYLIYDHLNNIKGDLDYSCICILLSKVVERELIKRLITDFQDYIDKKFGQFALKNYPEILLYNGNRQKAQFFSLASIPAVLCTKNYSACPESIVRHNRELFLEYANTKLFPGKATEEINNQLNIISKNTEKIRTQYRNPSAHTNRMNQLQAIECMEYIVETEKALRNMLEAFAS